jgi:hypothetical protein
MTRRAFMTLFGVPITGTTKTGTASLIPESRTGDTVPSEGFIFSGHLTQGSGVAEEGYYAIGQLVSFNLHPEASGMRAGADALLNKDVEIVLRRAS